MILQLLDVHFDNILYGQSDADIIGTSNNQYIQVETPPVHSTSNAVIQIVTDQNESDLTKPNLPKVIQTDEDFTNVNDYDFKQPVPKSEAAETSYFKDAVFIGDSRTEGLILNTDMSETTAYTYRGLMVDTVFTRPVISMNGKKIPVMDALNKTTFNKVYVMFGINEMGWPYNDVFIEKYKKIIHEIREINPSATIYLQSILPVSKSVSESHAYIRNKKVNEFNALILQMASEEEVYYLNVLESMNLEAGNLPENAASDGIHLKREYCHKWLTYLQEHTVKH